MLHRTCRIRLRVTPAQARRCYGLLRAGGDVWAALIEVNRARFRGGERPIANYQEWCREIAGVQVGELSVVAMRSVVRRYSDAFFETAKRRRAGERARYPRRKRALFPLRWYQGTFTLHGDRVRLGTARGSAPLWVRLSRKVPYPTEQLRSVTLLADGGRLWLDVTAAVPVESTSSPLLVTHRRAGAPPARRDRRRHLMDVHRSCPAPGRLRSRRSRSSVNATRASARRSVQVDSLDTRRGSTNPPDRAKVA